MRKSILVMAALVFFVGHAFAAGGLDGFISSLNIQARADLPGFTAKVSAQFGIPQTQVQATLSMVQEPADVFLVYQLGQMAVKPPETVVKVYQTQKGKGWGQIAKQLGIKPGSKEFHDLKNGNLALTGQPAETHGSGHGKGKGKGKGHNR